MTAAWWLDRVIPGLIDAIPFILVVGFGLQRHLKGTQEAVAEANRKQTKHLVAKTNEQTEQIEQIVSSLKGPQ